ncbi:hypothetical protein JL722_11301 [Aureococcus anophagefferens]|nr:hypothetical protein JL722_11301 [Aureococcus anophagefferens]
MRASLLLLLLAPASFALNKHVAIVTGGTRGIGKGIAEALASQSFDLLLTYNSDADAAAATAAEITEAYGCAVEYGDAYVDLCERGLARMGEGGGSLVGISSPGCTLTYKANLGYDMPGSGKCVMEYAMRLFALRAAKKNVNCNVVIPGVTTPTAGKLATRRGRRRMVGGIAGRIAPMGSMAPRAVGDGVAFLCSPAGRAVTGVSLPVDNGVHLTT